jgi:hypothetical protein
MYKIKKLTISLLLIISCSILSEHTQADTIAIQNINPTDSDNIQVEVSGCRGSLLNVKSVTVEKNGNNINILTDIEILGFSVPGCYKETVDIGFLSPGDYQISYFVSDRTPNFQGSISVSVISTSARNIPTLNVYGIIILTLFAAWLARVNSKSYL